MRRFLLVLGFALGPLAAPACATSNGESIPDRAYDASPLDASNNPDPFGGGGGGGGEGGADAGKDAVGTDGGNDAQGGDAGGDARADAPADAGPLDLRINELFVDNDLLGDGTEYVELRGTPGTALADLKLRLLANDGAVLAEVDVANAPGDAIGPSGLWVVGGSKTFELGVADNVDRVVSIAIWGLDNDRGAVQLVRGVARDLVDVVGYSTNPLGGAAPPPPSAPTATVENKVATIPSTAKKAFGRKSGAADTNDNSADFCTMTPTPGYPQAACD